MGQRLRFAGNEPKAFHSLEQLLKTAAPLTHVPDLIKRTFATFAQNLLTIIFLVAPVYLPLEIASSVIEQVVKFNAEARLILLIGSTLLWLLIGCFITPAILHAIAVRKLEGKRAGIREAYRQGLDFFPKSLSCRMRIGLFLCGGFLALVLPAIYLVVLAYLIDPVLFHENTPARDVFARSRTLTYGVRNLIISAVGVLGFGWLFIWSMDLRATVLLERVMPTADAGGIQAFSISALVIGASVLKALAKDVILTIFLILSLEIYLSVRRERINEGEDYAIYEYADARL